MVTIGHTAFVHKGTEEATRAQNGRIDFGVFDARLFCHSQKEEAPRSSIIQGTVTRVGLVQQAAVEPRERKVVAPRSAAVLTQGHENRTLADFRQHEVVTGRFMVDCHFERIKAMTPRIVTAAHIRKRHRGINILAQFLAVHPLLGQFDILRLARCHERQHVRPAPPDASPLVRLEAFGNKRQRVVAHLLHHRTVPRRRLAIAAHHLQLEGDVAVNAVDWDSILLYHFLDLGRPRLRVFPLVEIVTALFRVPEHLFEISS